MELKDELEEIFNIEDITPEHLQDDNIIPLINNFYIELKSEKTSSSAYLIVLTIYAISPFRNFESYLKIVTGLDGNVVQLLLKQYNSKYVTYEILPGVYTNREGSEVVKRDHKGTLRIEYDGVSSKTKLFLTHFVNLGFIEKTF